MVLPAAVLPAVVLQTVDRAATRTVTMIATGADDDAQHVAIHATTKLNDFIKKSHQENFSNLK